MDSIWILLDSVSVWILYGFCVDPDDIHGFCLDSVWVLSGFYLDSVTESVSVWILHVPVGSVDCV